MHALPISKFKDWRQFQAAGPVAAVFAKAEYDNDTLPLEGVVGVGTPTFDLPRAAAPLMDDIKVWRVWGEDEAELFYYSTPESINLARLMCANEIESLKGYYPPDGNAANYCVKPEDWIDE